MPGKRKIGELPKAMADLKSTSSDLSASDIEDLPRDQKKRVCKAFGEFLESNHPDKVSEYKVLAEGIDKREWVASFIVDPESGKNIGKSSASREIAKKDKGMQSWNRVPALSFFVF